MRLSHLLSVATIALLGTSAAYAAPITVGSHFGPWDQTIAGNPIYSGSGSGLDGDYHAPVSLGVTAGATIGVTYLSGLTSEFTGAVPTVDALGYVGGTFGTGLGQGQTGSDGLDFPSFLVSGSTGSPIYLGALIGDFVDASGLVLEAFAPGDGPFSIVAPTGAVAVQFGINDDIFSDNSGSLKLDVTGANAVSAVPEPVTLSLFGAGLAGAFAMRRRKKAKQA